MKILPFCPAERRLLFLLNALAVMLPWAASCAAAASPYIPHIPPAALAYQRTGYILEGAGILWHLLGFLLFLCSGLSVWARTKITAKWPPRSLPAAPHPAASALFYAFYSLAFTLWGLPFTLAWFFLERHYGFERESVPALFYDLALDWLLSLVTIPLLWGGYLLYAKFPRRWPLLLWAILAPLILAQSALQPIFIAPLFNRYTPFPQGPLRTQLLALAHKAGIAHPLLLVENTSRRTTHVNAYVTGWGPTTRIVVDDTSLKELPDREIEAMVSHEMGHYVEKHVWWETLGNILGAGLLLYLLGAAIPAALKRFGPRLKIEGPLDLAALPLILFLLYLLVQIQLPLANAESRYFEHRADAFGLRLSGLSRPMARLFVRFAEKDYSDPNPPALYQWWFGTHPTLDERIRFALSFRPSSASHTVSPPPSAPRPQEIPEKTPPSDRSVSPR